MSGSSAETALDNQGWLRTADLKKALALQGVELTDRMVRDWREEGIALPVRQLQTPGAGSETHHPPGALAQFQAAAAVKPRHFARMRWELWWQGFPIDRRYWRADLERQLASFEAGQKFARRALGWVGSRLSKIEGIAGRGSATTETGSAGILKTLRRVSLPQRLGVVRTVMEVANGDFTGFSSDEADEDIFASKDAMLSAMGMETSQRDSVFGVRIEASAVAEEAWRYLSDLQLKNSFIAAADRDVEQARDDLRNLLSAVHDFHAAARWVYGPQAFGLSVAASLFGAIPKLKQFWIVALVALRRSGYEMYNSAEIAEMARVARLSHEAVREIRRLATDERFRTVLTPAAFKKAFSSDFEYRIFKKRIAAAALSV